MHLTGKTGDGEASTATLVPAALTLCKRFLLLRLSAASLPLPSPAPCSQEAGTGTLPCTACPCGLGQGAAGGCFPTCCSPSSWGYQELQNRASPDLLGQNPSGSRIIRDFAAGCLASSGVFRFLSRGVSVRQRPALLTAGLRKGEEDFLPGGPRRGCSPPAAAPGPHRHLRGAPHPAVPALPRSLHGKRRTWAKKKSL